MTGFERMACVNDYNHKEFVFDGSRYFFRSVESNRQYCRVCEMKYISFYELIRNLGLGYNARSIKARLKDCFEELDADSYCEAFEKGLMLKAKRGEKVVW